MTEQSPPSKQSRHDRADRHFEHIGDLEAGLSFVLASTALLRPGGFAIHTTEFNVSSDEATLSDGGNVIYRRQDQKRVLTVIQARKGKAKTYGKPERSCTAAPPVTYNQRLQRSLG